MMRLWGFEMIMLGELEALGGKLGDHRVHIDILQLQTKGRTYCDTSVALSPAREQAVSTSLYLRFLVEVPSSDPPCGNPTSYAPPNAPKPLLYHPDTPKTCIRTLTLA